MMRDIICFFLSSLCCTSVCLAQSVVVEDGGLVLIEAEMAEHESWVLDTTIAGYTGEGYLLYTGKDLFNDPGNALLKFYVRIEKTGKYRFQWHSRIATGDSNTEHNDSWLRFPDAAKYYAVKADHIVYPKGTGLTPNPNGSSAKGWFKVYQNALGKWTWNTSTSDNSPHNIFVEFDTAGIYKLEISGRSKGHAINRLVLYHESIPFPTPLNLELPLSEVDVLSSTTVADPINLSIVPNPVYDEMTLDLAGVQSRKISIRIINTQGAIVLSRRFVSVGDQFGISMDGLPSGTYFLDAMDGVHHYIGKLVKL